MSSALLSGLRGLGLGSSGRLGGSLGLRCASALRRGAVRTRRAVAPAATARALTAAAAATTTGSGGAGSGLRLPLGTGAGHLALVDPDLHADAAEGRAGLVEAVVDVRTERVQGHAAL